MYQIINIKKLRSLFLLTFTLTSSLFLLPSSLYPQDTIRYMSYNLLNYGLPYNLCNESTNNIALKDQYISTIFSHVQPDLFAIVEMVKGDDNAKRLLDSAINKAGPRTFVKTTATNFSNSDIINMLYYDPVKFQLISQDVIINSLRDINLYNFYLKTFDLAEIHDTIFLTVIIAHLKAGSGQSNEMERASMTMSLMNYLNAQNKHGNIILSGDFNLYTSNESAYQNLINYSNASLRFYDPIDRPGSWNSDEAFADIHTQSTHSSSNGCAASGGLDDRFDFILTSNPLQFGTEGMQNITSSYRALGQDGLHFNTSVNVLPDNNSVPPDVLEALYNNSDHLPVVMDILTAKALAIHNTTIDPFGITVSNPVKENINIRIQNNKGKLKLEGFDLVGNQIIPQQIILDSKNSLSIPVQGLKPGLYLLKFTSEKGESIIKKVVIY